MQLLKKIFQESNIPLSPRQFWRYSLYFWGSFAVLSYLQVTLYEQLIDQEMFYTENLQWLVQWSSWIALTPFVLYAAHRFPVNYSLPFPQLLRRIGIHLLILSTIGLFKFSLEYLIVKNFYQLEAGINLTPKRIFVWLFSRYDLLIASYILVVLGYAVGVHIYRNQALLKQALTIQLANEQLNTQLAQAQLQALRMQLNPHFLFNTHHTIIGLMMQNENRKAIEMVKSLSVLLRTIVDNKDLNFVTVGQEIAFTEQYLHIQQIRFQDRLRIQITLQPGSETGLLPQFILQPLVENAFVHGLEKVAGQISLTIQAHYLDNQLEIRIEDNGLGINKSNSTGRTGVGISNTRQRLFQSFGEAATLTFEQPSSGGTTVILQVPFITETDLVCNEIAV